MRGRTSASRALLLRELPGWLTASAVIGTLGTCLWLERRRPLRRRTQSSSRRDLRNLTMAATTAVTIRAIEKPIVHRLATRAARTPTGLLGRLSLPPWAEVALAIVLLDYTLYVWHVLTHRVPFLWRFHRVHHADLDLSTTTALRFHFAEMALSVPWRALQVAAIGATPLSLSAWQTATLVAILFHHSNVELPENVERWLCRLMMTPRLHGIHHSIVPEQVHSNWSTILSWPDYLHHTARLDVAQERITIGVPDLREPRQLELPDLLRMPFEPSPSAIPIGTTAVARFCAESAPPRDASG